MNNGIAVIDDQTAVNAARTRGVQVRRTLVVTAESVRQGLLSADDAASLVDDLIEGGARFPCDGRTFIDWARSKSIL